MPRARRNAAYRVRRIACSVIRRAIAASSNAVLPARSPRPLTVTSMLPAPAITAARALAVAMPKSLCPWKPIVTRPARPANDCTTAWTWNGFQTPTVSARRKRSAPACRAARRQRARKLGDAREASWAPTETKGNRNRASAHKLADLVDDPSCGSSPRREDGWRKRAARNARHRRRWPRPRQGPRASPGTRRSGGSRAARQRRHGSRQFPRCPSPACRPRFPARRPPPAGGRWPACLAAKRPRPRPARRRAASYRPAIRAFHAINNSSTAAPCSKASRIESTLASSTSWYHQALG